MPDGAWTIAARRRLPGAVRRGDPRRRALAAEHDLVIVAVGEPSSLSGEASSRADIRLPGDQERLIHAIADTGVPFVVLLATGRPLVVEDWIERAPSVLLTWHLGTRGPEAIARVVSGAINPGGRVPMTFPRAVGQIPIHHDAENTGRPARTGGSMAVDRWDVGLQGPNNLDDYYTSKFLDLPRGPRFAFGHGLSYTTFLLDGEYRSPHADLARRRCAGGHASALRDVRNVGDRDGDDVVFVYLADPVASIAQPLQRLRGFQRVTAHPRGRRPCPSSSVRTSWASGTTRTRFVLEPGELVLTITDGTDSAPDADRHP